MQSAALQLFVVAILTLPKCQVAVAIVNRVFTEMYDVTAENVPVSCFHFLLQLSSSFLFDFVPGESCSLNSFALPPSPPHPSFFADRQRSVSQRAPSRPHQSGAAAIQPARASGH